MLVKSNESEVRQRFSLPSPRLAPARKQPDHADDGHNNHDIIADRQTAHDVPNGGVDDGVDQRRNNHVRNGVMTHWVTVF